MTAFFNEVIYRPLFNLTVAISNVMPGHDMGLAIIGLTLLVRVIFFPLSIKTIRSQKKLNILAPQVEEIKKKYKDDASAQSAAVLKLYKENNVNPVAGCLPLLIQLPILIGLYRAFISGLTTQNLSMLYGFVSRPESINSQFLNIVNITHRSIFLTLIAGLLQFLQSKMSFSGSTTGGKNDMTAMNKQMLYFLPIIIIIIGWNLPAGLILYWITTTLFSIFEQTYVNKNP